MTLTIIPKEEVPQVPKRMAYCPDCKIRASKIWISHDNNWVSIGFLCKKCGYIEIWGLADSLTKRDNDD